MWIAWNTALLWALVAAVFTSAGCRSTRRWMATAVTTMRELTVMLVLYSAWRFVHHLTIRQVTGAVDHARWLWRIERDLHLPSELSLQHFVAAHPLVAQAANGYYAFLHVPTLVLALVWLFARHRDAYPKVRNSLALFTAASLGLHLFPVAPPRMLPDLGFVDLGLRYHQSVYGPGLSGMSNQLAALPSIHVGWALIVGVSAVVVSGSRWRWLVLAHPALTIVAVVATGNHWWLDAIGAAGVLAVAAFVTDRAMGWWERPSSADRGPEPVTTDDRAVDQHEPAARPLTTA